MDGLLHLEKRVKELETQVKFLIQKDKTYNPNRIHYFKTLCKRYDTTPEAIKSNRRDKELVNIRYCIARELEELNMTYAEIGRIMGRDHTSIIHLLKVRGMK